jgi:hypothetical protein
VDGKNKEKAITTRVCTVKLGWVVEERSGVFSGDA